MSLNTAHANGGVLIYNGEIILLYCDGVEFTIEGNDAKQFGGTKKGRIYLTTHRMIFMNKSEKDNLQSFSFPFFSLSGVELEQPIFGANYIKGNVIAQAGGNWTGKATFKLKFFSGGAIEFGQAMVKAAKMASQYMPPQPPPYTPHQGPYFPAPPPAYMPPAGGVNGFIPPTDAFPSAPPANSVYTMDMPPPYPGIYPPPYAYAPGSGMYPQAGANGVVNHPHGPPPPGFTADGGASAAPPAYGQYAGTTQEAPPLDSKSGYPPPMQNFYQHPYNQQMMYGPPPNMNGQPPAGPPPPYNPENYKKNQ